MWILMGAVLSASLVGSLHCVGMCGPLAIWASGAGERQRTAQMAWAVSLYHVGRLLTYALAGLLAGGVGQLADWGGQTLGIQLFAARVVGVLMIIIGGFKLGDFLLQRRLAARSIPSASRASLGSWITQSLVKLRPYVFRLPVPARGLVTGLLTALLPCGWLYLFALLAAGTGSPLTGMLVMMAFWLGTVPALVALVSGLQFMRGRVRQWIPAGAALLLIAAGLTTASGRGFANLRSLNELHVPVLSPPNLVEARQSVMETPEVLARRVGDLVKTPLPCCSPPGSELQTQPAQQGEAP
jgi:uncharacterized protein